MNAASPGGASRPPPPSPSPPANSMTASAPRSLTSRRPWVNSARSCGKRDDPGCVQPYQEAMELFQRIGDRRSEATAAFNLGHAYKDIPALRDLDQAEQWYRRDLELLEEHDTLGRARGTAELGNVAYERFKDARDAGAPARAASSGTSTTQPAPTTRRSACSRTTRSANSPWPTMALGNIYGEAGDTATALGHYQRAIQYCERQDDRYGAGWARHAAAVALADAGRQHDALLYARAALRDFEAVGPGAADRADRARQLITELEQEPSDDHDAYAGDAT